MDEWEDYPGFPKYALSKLKLLFVRSIFSYFYSSYKNKDLYT